MAKTSLKVVHTTRPKSSHPFRKKKQSLTSTAFLEWDKKMEPMLKKILAQDHRVRLSPEEDYIDKLKSIIKKETIDLDGLHDHLQE